MLIYRHGYSQGARILAQQLGIKLIRNKIPKPDLVLNWGNSSIPAWYSPHFKWINHPSLISRASNKLITFNILHENNISCIPFTTDMSIAKQWINEGNLVYCRTILNGTKGHGIVIAENIKDLVPAKLYTKYINGNEYRIHIFKDKCIDYQKKRKRLDIENDGLIKNLDNGWIYARENLTTIEDNIDLAKECIKALELDFGAVEIIRSNKKSYILEVNTAPGLEGQTINNYVRAISELNGLEN